MIEVFLKVLAKEKTRKISPHWESNMGPQGICAQLPKWIVHNYGHLKPCMCMVQMET